MNYIIVLLNLNFLFLFIDKLYLDMLFTHTKVQLKYHRLVKNTFTSFHLQIG